MTTIIISVLLALGIGGGVMVASSGGGGESSGGAVVAPPNPGGSGGGGSSGGGSSTGGGTTGSSNVGALLASGSSSGITVMGKAAQGNTSLSGKILTIGMAPYAPILVSGTTYKTNEEYDTADINYLSGGNTYSGTLQFISGYTSQNPIMKQNINLENIDAYNDFADFYVGPGYVTKSLPTLNITYLKANRRTNGSWYGQTIGPTTYNDITWRFTIWDFALGARHLGLQNGEFGYYTWGSEYMGANIDAKRFTRYGASTFYMYKTSKQFTGNYIQRYGNTVNFEGNIIGAIHSINYVCGSNNSGAHINGNISLSLNLENKTLVGSITNTKAFLYGHGSTSGTGVYHVYPGSVTNPHNWYNFTLEGNINIGNSTTPNITFTKIDYDREQTASVTYANFDGKDLHPLDNNTNFGDAVILAEGSNASKDEMVGQINFTGHRLTDGTAYFQDVFISFGAKKQ